MWIMREPLLFGSNINHMAVCHACNNGLMAVSHVAIAWPGQ
jgi:hypothetical protein